jgi:hypothetical protein
MSCLEQSDLNEEKYCEKTGKNVQFSNKLVRAAGDWAGPMNSSLGNWSACEPLGQMKYDNKSCNYKLVLNCLPIMTIYRWKVAINNKFDESYGN